MENKKDEKKKRILEIIEKKAKILADAMGLERKKALQKLIEDFNILKNNPREVRIRNFPEVQKIEGTVSISGVNKEGKIELVLPKEKENKWIGEIMVHTVKAFTHFFSTVFEKGIKVKLDDEERMNPMRVIVVDRLGRPVNLGGGMMIPMLGGQVGGTPPPSTVTSGRKEVAVPGTAQRLVSSSTPCKRVTITGLPDNTNYVCVGGSATLATAGSESGIVLSALGMTTIEIDDLFKVYVDAVDATDGVSFTYER